MVLLSIQLLTWEGSPGQVPEDWTPCPTRLDWTPWKSIRGQLKPFSYLWYNLLYAKKCCWCTYPASITTIFAKFDLEKQLNCDQYSNQTFLRDVQLLLSQPSYITHWLTDSLAESPESLTIVCLQVVRCHRTLEHLLYMDYLRLMFVVF